MKFAVMIQERYARHLAPQWITHTVEDDANKAYYQAWGFRAQGCASCVVEYHSQEWERLVR